MSSTTSTTPSNAIGPLILSIDVGSSSVRVIGYDRRGLAVGGMESHRPYRPHTDGYGAVEVDPDKLVDMVAACIDDAISGPASTAPPVVAVACCTFWHSLIGVDANGKAITPVYTWADTRSRVNVNTLKTSLDETAFHKITGTVFHSSYWPAKIAWLQQVQPDLVKKTRFWMSFGEYLYLNLFRQRRVSISMASGTGLFDQHSCTWCADLLGALGVREEQLSPICDYTDALTGLCGQFSERWTRLRDVPWFLPLGDGACNNVGSGAYDDTHVAMMVGTSGAMRVVRETEIFDIPPGLWTYRVDRRRIVQGGALSEGGNVFGWLVDGMNLPEIPDLESRLATMMPDQHGLTVLPFFAGERSPHWRSDMRATFHGMTLDTTPVDIARACLEAIALRFVLVHRALAAQLLSLTGIIGTGVGLIHSAVWMRIMCDALDQPLTPCMVPEATSRGGALLALQALRAVDDFAGLEVAVGETYLPRVESVRAYRAALQRHEDLYRRLADFNAVPETSAL